MSLTNTKRNHLILTIVLALLALFFLSPILIVFMNSFKSKLFISNEPFAMPSSATFSGGENYISGSQKIKFFNAFGYSLFITVFSVIGISLVTSMLAWYLTRVKTKFTTFAYYLLVFSMIVPFQMVMFTMSKTANMLHLDNPIGILVLYIGFGAGLGTFMFSGFIKSIPLSLEEAAMIDGAGPVKTFFLIVFPILKPTAITVAILNTMWVWNDYLLPYLTIGTEYKTIPVAIQYLRGGYGAVDMGAMMAMLVLAMVPIIVFYLSAQKYIIRGVVAGAVKG
ncbi:MULTISPECIES: carbohydrate ABC transporter permease [Sphaerochaeta]|jgi:raffinose/stachyose/melibiose transport system permease protein|uniref:carbohydrate ABC transporter permease n=1 Tax=Sphaerochaeta TaxID=399320 RepID=UPI000AED3E0D|nr:MULTISPECIES: carbohydrate ABC transporter permease [Sphaerochaeta]MDT3359597.1 carbohydrate ABC transporter permease [Spirochaetota bacterium]MDD2396346.1 carbohydrate ABC transporter permease [Sphaerochaeta sp.]MDD3424240.1 carbohydrate ABC transporter permease [Sphaerochaeta sp.]MDD3455865.1 carbohydrate ABC transporter permease [Sphaerochaeta sp.]MDD4038072.1 carbohydrate ABC transporter permease [Sphaerochaeta sp.]